MNRPPRRDPDAVPVVKVTVGGEGAVFIHDASPADVRSRIASAAAAGTDVLLPGGRRLTAAQAEVARVVVPDHETTVA